jgi:hypothetical protein
MSTVPVPPPQPARSNALWWILGILGILGACFVILVLGSVLIGLFLARQVHVHQAGNKVEIQTPMGAINVNKDQHTAGLPVYPGATSGHDDTGNVEINAMNHSVGLAIEKYTTPDSYEKVQEWYRKRLGPDFSYSLKDEHPPAEPNNRRNSPGSMNFNDADGAFVSQSNDGAKVVALKRIGEGTQIELLRVGRKELQ